MMLISTRSLLVVAAVSLLATHGSLANAQAWMNPTTNDGSFDAAWGVTLTGGLGDIKNSEDENTRSSGVWSYDVFDGAGTPLPLGTDNLGFVEFRTNLSPNNGNVGEILASEGSQNPDNTFGSSKAVSAFVDPSDRKVVYTTGLLSIPGSPSAGDVLTWSFEIQGKTGHFPVNADVNFEIDLGGGNVESSGSVTATDPDGLRNTFDVISGARVLSVGDLTAGTFSVGFSIENLQASGASSSPGRIFLDNINIGIGTLPGDIDGDGAVTITDFGFIRDNFRETGATMAMGDLTGPHGSVDGIVDFYDFIEWSDAFVAAGGNLAAISFIPIPEPSSCLLAVGMLLIASLKRHR